MMPMPAASKSSTSSARQFLRFFDGQKPATVSVRHPRGSPGQGPQARGAESRKDLSRGVQIRQSEWRVQEERVPGQTPSARRFAHLPDQARGSDQQELQAMRAPTALAYGPDPGERLQL